ASSDTMPRPSLWITWPLTPSVPGGPPGRRLPTPNRRTSIGIDRPAGSAAALRATRGLRADRRLRPRELRLRVVAQLREPDLVRPEDRREPEEPDPEHHRHPDREDHEDDDELEGEDRGGDQQPEQAETRPQQPLPQVEVRGVAVERPGPEVVEDHEDPEEHERR